MDCGCWWSCWTRTVSRRAELSVPKLRALNPSSSSPNPSDKRDKELVIAALGGIGSVFQLQTSTPRNDFCRMFVREGLEDPLSTALANITQDKDEGAEEAKEQILAVFLLFCQISQSDKRVRDALGKRRILKRTIPSIHFFNRLQQPDIFFLDFQGSSRPAVRFHNRSF